MITSVKIERYKDCEELVRILSRSEAAPATNKDLIRPRQFHMLVGTHVPEQYQCLLGALVTLLFRDPKVIDVEIWRRGNGNWIAGSLVETARGYRLRRGEGATPLEAFACLVLDIYR